MLAGHSASAFTITLNGGSSTSLVQVDAEAAGVGVTDYQSPAVLPYSDTSTVATGGAFAEAVYSLSNAGFSISFESIRTGSTILFHSHTRFTANIYFSVDQAINYIASGWYSANDPFGGTVRFKASLFDITTSSSVFFSEQWSQTTQNESFTLGLAEGDFLNSNSGSLTGALIAGHDYHFSYWTFLSTFTRPNPSGATASGNLTLSFIAVPEPTTTLLLAASMLGLMSWRRRLH